MRSLMLRLIISVFMLFPTVQAKESLDLFKIEKPIEQYNASDINLYLQQAMGDLLVRLVGDAEFASSPEAGKFIRNARQWVLRFQLVNREIDGVVIGQSLAVEFDRNRLLAELQASGIHIWPLNYRPQTFMLGQWEHMGLRENISEQSLEYRIDLDYRGYSRLLGLPVKLPQDSALFELIPSPQVLVNFDPLPTSLLSNIEFDGPFLFVYKADQIGQVIRWIWRLYSLSDGALLFGGEDVGESFDEMMKLSLNKLLDFYSTPYRQGLGTLGLIEVEVSNITSYQVFSVLESFMLNLQPIATDVKLVGLNNDVVKFEVTYTGQLSNLLDELNKLKRVQWNHQTLFQGQLKGQYQP